MNLNRTGRVGALCWVVAAPVFLVASLVTGLRWRQPTYSWATHNISDLGNVNCGIWDTTRPRYVCSPWHPLLNAAMLTTAVLLAVGLLLTWRLLGRGGAVRSAQTLLLLASGGYALAALYPADVDENLHVLGAFLIMGLGNVGLLLAGFAPQHHAARPMATPHPRRRPDRAAGDGAVLRPAGPRDRSGRHGTRGGPALPPVGLLPGSPAETPPPSPVIMELGARLEA